ncbi:MAG: transposase [Halobacteriota archaeon]|nr:transposase [Halobacteriota archaeon]
MYTQKKTVDVYGNGDTKTSNCPHCGSDKIIRYGKQINNRQRYKCNHCSKTFNGRFGTPFYRKRLSDEIILQIVYLFRTGYPTIKMLPLFEVTENTIRNIRGSSCILKGYRSCCYRRVTFRKS